MPRVPAALRSRAVLGGVVLLLVLVVAGVVLVVVRPWSGDSTRLEQALALAPASTARFSWTDWAAVRAELGADLSGRSSAGEINDFLDKGFDADLTSESSLVDSADLLQRAYGVSPASADWELLAQSDQGALLIVGLPSTYDFDALADRLDGLGYRHASGSDDVDAWDGGSTVVSDIGDVSPQLSYLGIDADDHVLVASDEAEYVAGWRESMRGDDLGDGIGQAAVAMGDAESASVYSGDYACGALAMTSAGDDDRVRAEELIGEAGEVGPYEGFAIGLLPGGGMRVTMAFDTDAQARTNADSRAKLAAGPAPGQGGAFPDRFSVDQVVADGDVVRMDLDPVSGSYPLSDLSSGPVLFATC